MRNAYTHFISTQFRRRFFPRARLFVVACTFVACRDATDPLPIARASRSPLTTIVSGAGAITIPTLGGQRSNATAINSSGQVVGSSEPFFNGPQHAFLWQSGQSTAPIDLGTLGGRSSFASAISPAGHVVGTSYLAGNSVTHGFIWQNGAMLDIGTAIPAGVNASGQIVGWYYTGGIPNYRRPAYWPTPDEAAARGLPLLGGTDGAANGINSAGKIVGWSFTAGNVEIHGVVWQDGQATRDLGTLGGGTTQAMAINTAGQVVGWSTLPGAAGDYHAVLWQPGATAPQDLGTLGGTQSVATAINDAGQVVGWSMTAGNAARRVFLWTPSDGMEDLGLLGWDEVNGVNANLQLVGGSTPGPAQLYQINFQPRNYAPVVTSVSVPGAAVPTGTSVNVSAAFTDVNAADAHTSVIDWGDASTSVGTISEGGNGTGSVAGVHTYVAAGTYAVRVTVTDNGLLSGTRSSTDGAVPVSVVVYVNNVAPVVTSLVLPADPVAISSSASITATFTDADDGDTHTALVDWGDGESSPATVTDAPSGAGTVAGVHTYSAAGVYTVSVTVTDQGLLSDTRSSSEDATATYLVAYDPLGGYVAGHGSIVSPAGAYTQNPTATGKASFGFVSKYARGATLPSGTTQFQFSAGQFIFESTSYEWLVIAGGRAKYKGSGTINNSGSYTFLLTAVDGQANSGGVDAFRLKVWNPTTGLVIYDNEMGASDDAPASTMLATGSIKIHK
jgi:probable HAF family extracellular repeat protein